MKKKGGRLDQQWRKAQEQQQQQLQQVRGDSAQKYYQQHPRKDAEELRVLKAQLQELETKYQDEILSLRQQLQLQQQHVVTFMAPAYTGNFNDNSKNVQFIKQRYLPRYSNYRPYANTQEEDEETEEDIITVAVPMLASYTENIVYVPKEKKQFQECIVQVTFPDGMVLQCCLSPVDTIAVLQDIVKKYLAYEDHPFHLCVYEYRHHTPRYRRNNQRGFGRTLLDHSRLYERVISFGPFVRIFFEWKKGLPQDTDATQDYLYEDVLSVTSVPVRDEDANMCLVDEDDENEDEQVAANGVDEDSDDFEHVPETKQNLGSFGILPKEIIKYIFSFVPLFTLAHIRVTCRFFHQVSTINSWIDQAEDISWKSYNVDLIHRMVEVHYHNDVSWADITIPQASEIRDYITTMNDNSLPQDRHLILTGFQETVEKITIAKAIATCVQKPFVNITVSWKYTKNFKDLLSFIAEAAPCVILVQLERFTFSVWMNIVKELPAQGNIIIFTTEPKVAVENSLQFHIEQPYSTDRLFQIMQRCFRKVRVEGGISTLLEYSKKLIGCTGDHVDRFCHQAMVHALNEILFVNKGDQDKFVDLRTLSITVTQAHLQRSIQKLAVSFGAL